MVKILKKYGRSILVYNLFYRQTVQYFHTPVIRSLYEIHVYIFKKYDWAKKYV